MLERHYAHDIFKNLILQPLLRWFTWGVFAVL